MHLCFIDESGTPPKAGKLKPAYFVIAGLVVPEERWRMLADKLHGLKVGFGYRGELKWRYFAPNNSDNTNPMAAWDQAKRNRFRDAVFRILRNDKSLTVVACVCQAATIYRLSVVNNQDDVYYRAYKVVTERFQYLLQDISRTSGTMTRGIIVADHRGRGDDAKLREQHRRLVEENQAYASTYNNLVEGLFLAPSHLSVGIQLVDMVAGAIWRRFEANDATWFDQIKERIRKGAAGQIDGYGIARLPKPHWTGPVP